MPAHMRDQAATPGDSKHEARHSSLEGGAERGGRGHERMRASNGEHGAAWMLLYLLAAAVVAALVWVIFGGVA